MSGTIWRGVPFGTRVWGWTGREIVLEDPIGRILSSINRVGPFFCVQESLGEGVVFDLQRRDFLVLVSGDCNELSLWEGISDHLPIRAADSNKMNPRLIFVQRVQHDLSISVCFIREFHLCERNRLLHPVRSEIRRFRVNVNWIVGRGFGFATGNL